MAAQDPNRIRPNVSVPGDVVRERDPMYPEGETVPAGERVRDTARHTAERAQETARSALSAQKDRAASSLDDIVEVLHATGQQFRDHDRSSVADLADRAADRVERFARNLQDRDVGELIADVEDLARRQPELVLGGAFVIGLLGARFLKSSSSRMEQQMGQREYTRPGGVTMGRDMTDEPMPYETQGMGI